MGSGGVKVQRDRYRTPRKPLSRAGSAMSSIHLAGRRMGIAMEAGRQWALRNVFTYHRRRPNFDRGRDSEIMARRVQDVRAAHARPFRR